ncbi:glycoside hydrolase family 31 protein [Pararcticibacter amylolyticus]|uniref:Alpha-glycosidase n=1 Tax=Pararcticibacter amylolyticus TaxID=2173175 RepID=A0A2U2PC44_9SPHI|nr:TIM-barrel domain-containing protein [Pararcticibacter amylolyticus]PWG78976.1 alpha-glycosidase [Pararcticibacter amylolyticus]
MQRDRVLIFLFLFLFPLLNKAQSVGNYSSGFKKEGNEYHFRNGNADVKLEFCTPGMFRVRTSWSRSFEPEEDLMVSNYKWAAVGVNASEEPGCFLLKTEKLDIKVFKAPFYIEVYSKDGQLLSTEQGLGAEKKGDTVSCAKVLMPDEHFFGFGERMDFIDRRSKKVNLNVGRGKGRPHMIGAYNILEANYSPVPFFMSTRGYGVFLHNSYATEWDMGSGSDDRYLFKAASGELDYYFIYGPDFPAILNDYTALTGRSPLLPQFALGLHAGTYSGGTWGHEKETSDAYVVALARRFRELGIPVDLLWLDSTWRIFGTNGGNGATSFEWRDTFKDPKGMFDSLYAMKYKMVGLHLRPRFDNGIKLNLLDQAREKGLVYPEPDNKGEFVNFFDRKSVDWWWDNGVMRVASIGAKFLKTDEGSAFGGLANESNKTGPTDKAAQKLHNVFPVAYAKAPYEKFQEFNGIRGLNQTREGYAGIQRYPFIFAGDWPSEWQYFAPVIKAGINIGLSGVGYWAHCMGGFERPADPELYIRWVQFGMFSPVALVFGMDHPGYKEPWAYGDQALANFKKYDILRYRLIPYIYSNAYTMYKTGLPLMKGLVMDYRKDANVYDIGDQYLFGNNLMVCPVTTKGAQTRTVYLPEGTWFDYWTGKKYAGKQYVHVVCPLDTIPLFAKAGAVIPMQPEMLYSGEKPVNEIMLDIFPGSGSFSLYEDDGVSLGYKSGKFALTEISVDGDANGVKIDIRKPEGSFKPSSHTYLLKIRLEELPGKIPEVTENGKKNVRGVNLDKKDRVLYVKTISDNRKDISVNIRFQ